MTRGGFRTGRWSLLFFLLLPTAGGCVGDPDVDVAPAPLALDLRVERALWEHAPPGCEDVAADGMRVAACEGQPALAALIDYEGRVRCVDAVSLLVLEAHSMSAPNPLANDPSPQPNRPPPPDGTATPLLAR